MMLILPPFSLKVAHELNIGLQNTMRDITITLAISILLMSCSGPDENLQNLAQNIYSQKTWEQPLPPNDFKSDGCSCWPDHDWASCCVEHDLIYWMGGSRERRKQADIALKKCVSRKGYPSFGNLMYYGVRLGGVYWLPIPFRWGFGWSYPQAGPPGSVY